MYKLNAFHTQGGVTVVADHIPVLVCADEARIGGISNLPSAAVDTHRTIGRHTARRQGNACRQQPATCEAWQIIAQGGQHYGCIFKSSGQIVTRHRRGNHRLIHYGNHQWHQNGRIAVDHRHQKSIDTRRCRTETVAAVGVDRWQRCCRISNTRAGLSRPESSAGGQVVIA